MTLPGSEPAAAPTDPDALADRVRRVEEQPLEERAAGFRGAARRAPDAARAGRCGVPDAGAERLDAALAARGLVKSRTAAAKLIQAGRVSVDGVTAIKASAPVAEHAVLAVDPEDDWVSRAAHKLVGALDAFGVQPAGRVALDVGASTGGFTQVLLDRGAERVVALDVGHGQLDPRIAIDPRVVSVEGVNARSITAEQVRRMDDAADRIDLIVGDLSFISLRLVLPALVDAVVRPLRARDLVLLVKPQFEVGRTGIREGIVHDADLRNDAVMNVLWTGWDLGLGTVGVVPSSIVGTHGNREFLVHLRPLPHEVQHAEGEHDGAAAGTPGPNPTEWIDRVTRMTEGT